jgi:protein O-GlcNAc transferase
MLNPNSRPSSKGIFAALLGLALASSASAQTAAVKEADTAFRTGYAAFSSNRLEEARADFQKVVELAPQLEEGHSALGAVLLHLHVYPAAISELKQALKMKPNDVSAQTNLAFAYAATGRDREALPLFAKLGPSADILAAYARSLAATGQMTSAVEKMKEAVALAPDAAHHDALGSLYAQQQNWSSAAEEFTTALQLDPLFAVAHLHPV